MNAVLDTLSLVLILFGAALCLTAAIGLLRFHDVPTRLHAATKPQVLGIILLLLGKRPSTWLHLVYGFGPFVILAIAHALARDLQKTQPGKKPIPAWVPFAFGAFICFGLTLRALMTGLGVG